VTPTCSSSSAKQSATTASVSYSVPSVALCFALLEEQVGGAAVAG